MMDDLEDIERFLKNVDNISELVNNLNSTDTEVQRKAMEKADCYIAAMNEPCREKVSKATINTNPSTQTSLTSQNQTVESFMKAMEKDIVDRRLRRIESEKKATALKDKGNDAYAREDYETAVKYYSDGLAELRDMQSLYTNRAQAYIKLGKYTEAIDDCEWALRCNKKCIKAYVHMGKAYLALKNYSESRNCFGKIVETEPGREKMVKEYLIQVDLEEEREIQEKNAQQDFDKGEEEAIRVPQLLEKLSRPGHMPLYYCGGLEILSKAVTDCTGQNLFRLNNGFSIISSNDTVRSCLRKKTMDPFSQEVCVSVVKLWRVSCCGNDENLKTLMTCPVFRNSIVDWVASEHVAIQQESLALLCLYSRTPRGRNMVMDNLEVQKLLKNLMAYISESRQQRGNAALNILEHFAAEKKFHVQIRPVVTDCVTGPFTRTLKNINASDRSLHPALISVISSLARDDIIRYNLCHDPGCWKAFLVAIKQCREHEYREILYPMLGLIINLSTVTSPAIQEHGVSLCSSCLDLLKDSDGGIITRATGVLSTTLPQSPDAVQYVIQGGVVRTMCRLLKGNGQNATKYAIKTLTVCTAASHLAREELVKADKKLSMLRRLLDVSGDETVSGNAALCMAHCLEVDGTARNLLGTDAVLILLRHAAGDAKKTAVQQNAAIALGKLCRSERRHVEKLRELHGFEILHSCMKLIT